MASRSILAGIVLALSMATQPLAQAAVRHDLDIPAQQLGSALTTLARQARIQVVYAAELVEGKTSTAIAGSMTPEEALERILGPANLQFEFIDASTVTLKRSGAGTEVAAPAGDKRAVRPLRTASLNNQMLAGMQRTSAPQGENAAGGGSGQSEGASQGPMEEVVITGSRIARADYNTPTPVNLLTAETLEQASFSNLSDTLIRTPQFGAGLGSANSYYNADAGASFVNLRGLGTDRTLVLVNGRRRVSGTELSSAVDLTTIPTNMIERVEVITGGAAAVYGADAVTGVVNVTLKQNVDGFELSGKSGMSGHGDAQTYSVGALFGAPVSDDRGSFTVGLSYNEERPLAARQRDFGRRQVDLFGNPANTGPNDGIYDSIAVSNYRYPGTSYGGAFVVDGVRYTYDGGLRPTRNDATPYGPLGFLGVGGDGFNDEDFYPLRNESRVVAALARFDYKLAEWTRFFSEFQFANTKTVANLQPTYDFDLIVSRDNPLLPADVAALMDANGLTQIEVGRTNVDQGVSQRLIDRDTWTIVSGLQGDFGADYEWTAFYQYGRYKNNTERTNDRINSRFLEALDVVAGPGGVAQCASATARAAGCQPLAILGPNAASQEAIDYFRYNQHRDVTNTQSVGGLQLTGSLFDLPAGPVGIATGVEYRKESLSVNEDGLASLGLLFNNAGQSVDANVAVKEAFGEVLVPVLADLPFVRRLSLEGAARYSDYDTIGSTFAWKLGGQYSPVQDIRFRVTRSSSVRAPSLNELFSPGTFSTSFILDPCDATRVNLTPNRAANCAALGIAPGYTDPRAGEAKTVRSGGNPDLDEESSLSWTVGMVITPSALPDLSVSVDWWKIEISEAINGVPLQSVVDGCVDVASIDNPYCSLITRRADDAIDVVNSSEINVGKLAAEGVDFQANYGIDIGTGWFNSANRLRFALAGTYLSKNELIVDSNDPSSIDINDGEVENPTWRFSVTPGFTAGPLSIDWTVRYIDSTKADVEATAESRSDNNVASRIYNDLYASFGIGDSVKVYGGVNNVLDEDPPFSRETFQGTARGVLFDNIGRYFFVGTNVGF